MTLLDLADYKGLVGTTSATDAAIELALATEEAVVLEAIGPIGDQAEHFAGGQTDLMLGRRAVLLLRVFERIGLSVIELDTTDYALSSSGAYVSRLTGGTHPSRYWRGQAEVRYQPVSGVNLAKSVQAELVALDVGDNIGANAGQRTQERIGEWSETFATSSAALTPEQRRESILARLTPGIMPYWRASGHSSVPGPAGS